MRRSLFRFALFAFLTAHACLLAALLTGCEDVKPATVTQSALNGCTVSDVRLPTETHEEFVNVYNGRTFFADGVHLGYDILLPEGTPIHPIACGTIVFYGEAKGYGTLAVVIEHTLPRPITVRNGKGETVTITTFLSIYGHLRSTSLIDGGTPTNLHVGDIVGPQTVIGYVQNGALNGDGMEHLHLGIRLQSATDAQQADDHWFRGYDNGLVTQRQWYADPVDFLYTLMKRQDTVHWHPAGTILAQENVPGEMWIVDDQNMRRLLTPENAKKDHLQGRAITASVPEMNCYGLGDPYVPELPGSRLIKFDDASAVYEYTLWPTPRTYAFISYEAFVSWGWKDADVEIHPAIQRPALFAVFPDAGFRRLRDGTLVKGWGQSEVAVVSNGQRLPIFDWDTFVALGYRPDQIVEVDPSTLDAVAYARGPTITPDLITLCHHPNIILCNPCDGGMGGGIGEPSPDASVGKEICNGLDDDGNGLIDEIFLCPLGRHGPICVTACGTNGYRVCEAPNCDWSAACYPFPENCDNAIDDDCDGKMDCVDANCVNDPACAPKSPDMGVPALDLADPPVEIFVQPDLSVPPDMGILRDMTLPIVPDLASPPPDLKVNDHLYIQAGPALLASCKTGLVILVWDPRGNEIRSSPGQPLDLAMQPAWKGWAMTTTVCNGAYHGDWAPKGGSARDAGFASVRVSGRELLDVRPVLCADPYDGRGDTKLAIPLEIRNQGLCPP